MSKTIGMIMGLAIRIGYLVLHIYTAYQIWGSGFWRTALTICIPFSPCYWAYQWWQGLGMNYGTIAITISSYILFRMITGAITGAIKGATEALQEAGQ
jgi:hypothetical protein